MPSAETVFDFRRPEALVSWESVSDPVMGGVSRGTIKGDEVGAIFAGTVSLENNGGFASVHAPVDKGVLAGCGSICLRCCGDGRQYSLRLREDEAFDGISYRCDFQPPADQWVEVELPLADFRPVFRGRELTTAGPLQAEDIIRLGFLIARQPGTFALRIEWIKMI